jgi:hypothetical protein
VSRSSAEHEKGKREKRRPLVSAIMAALHVVSLAALLCVVCAAIVSRQINPFYEWIAETPLHRVGQYIVGILSEQDLLWRRRLAGAPLLQDEEKARQELISRIEQTRPTHGVLLTDGRRLFGSLTEIEPGAWTFEFEDKDGVDRLKLTDTDIRWHKRIVYPPVELMPEDVRFLLNFPNFTYHYLPPYLFVANVPCNAVQEAFNILSQLSESFEKEFAPLLPDRERTKLAYVCFFRDEEQYLKYAIEKEDVNLEVSVGFYSQTEDCLFVYDRLNSFARAKIDRAVERLSRAASIGTKAIAPEELRRLVENERQRSYDALRHQITETLRHEGGHQLAFSRGVHSAQGFEHLWVQEGLAQFCETTPMGAIVPSRMDLLKKAHEARHLIPWPELVDTPTPRGFAHYDDRADLAYAQSWLLFRHLMGHQLRARFMVYLDRVHALKPSDLGRPRTAIFDESVGVPLLEIAHVLKGQLTDHRLTEDLPPLTPRH